MCQYSAVDGVATDWHLVHIGSRAVGVGKGDSKLYVWSLSWLPYALTHGLSPFFTTRVFAPGGADLTWVTTLPAPALVLWPVTALVGPLAAYNVLLLLAPALAGWATFLLCRQVTDRFWASVAGGYLVGFSTYMVGQLHGHANLVLLFPAPLAAYLVLRRLRGTIPPLGFVAALAATLLFLFGSSTELFATTTLFGVAAFVVALALFPERRRIFGVGLLVALAYAVVGLLLLPFLLDAFRNVPGAPLRPIDRASTDLLSFVLPRTSTLIGGARFRGVTSRFTASIVEDGGYLGAPLLLAIAAATVGGWRRRATWFLLAFSGVAAFVALDVTQGPAGAQTPPAGDVVQMLDSLPAPAQRSALRRHRYLLEGRAFTFGRIPPGAQVRSFPVVERDGIVWIWMGEAAHADADAIPDFSFLTATDCRALTGTNTVAAHYELVVDNLLDLSHINFLHANYQRNDDLLKALRERSAGRVAESEPFRKVQKDIAQYEQRKSEKSSPLVEADVERQGNEGKAAEDEEKKQLLELTKKK